MRCQKSEGETSPSWPLLLCYLVPRAIAWCVPWGSGLQHHKMLFLQVDPSSLRTDRVSSLHPLYLPDSLTAMPFKPATLWLRLGRTSPGPSRMLAFCLVAPPGLLAPAEKHCPSGFCSRLGSCLPALSPGNPSKLGPLWSKMTAVPSLGLNFSSEG